MSRAAAVLRPVRPGNRLAREAVLSAAAAAAAASLLAWLGPPGSDLAAHAYQRAVFLQHGFSLWNNFWYAGRYSFVTYSLLYYPLAALLGIRLLAVATVADGRARVRGRARPRVGPDRALVEPHASPSSGPAIVLSAAFPFALGAALALLAIWALQARRRWRFAALALLTLAASPVAFLLLALVLGGDRRWRAGPRQPRRRRSTSAVAAALELVLWRLFPGGGQFPFSLAECLAACVFCLIGAALRGTSTRALAWIYARVPRGLLGRLRRAVRGRRERRAPALRGDPDLRARALAAPLAAAAGRACVALGARGLVEHLAARRQLRARRVDDPTAHAAYWAPAVGFLRQRLTPRTASRRWTRPATGTRSTCRGPASRSRAAGSGRTTSRRTSCSTASSRLGLRRLAAVARRPLRRPHRRAAGLQRARARRRCCAAGAPGSAGLPVAAHTRVRACRSPRPIVTGPGRARVVRVHADAASSSRPRAAAATGSPSAGRRTGT